MTFIFEDKVVVVTGGAGGIGSAVSRTAAERGAVVVVVDLDGDRARSLAGSLPHRKHLGIGADLTVRTDVDDLLTRVQDVSGRIDVLVNNVGMTSSERFDTRSVESIEQELDVNLLSPLVLTRLAIPLLQQAVDPRVVTTVSLGGIFPLGETPIYTASKFGLRGAMLSIGLDLRAKGIRAGSVMPSAVDTRMLQQEAIDGGNSLQFQEPPLRPEDVVRSIVSLLDRPRLEAYPRYRESVLTRVAMLAPNLLPLVLPLFRAKGDRGMQTYLHSLEDRGLVRAGAGGWEWSTTA
jgi:NAD(P)-dependent dehydrogenase (short-subunit alcohol dehydrogenase family)